MLRRSAETKVFQKARPENRMLRGLSEAKALYRKRGSEFDMSPNSHPIFQFPTDGIANMADSGF